MKHSTATVVNHERTRCARVRALVRDCVMCPHDCLLLCFVLREISRGSERGASRASARASARAEVPTPAYMVPV